MEAIASPLRKELNSVPHYEVVGSHFLLSNVRGAKLEDAILAELEEKCSGGGACFCARENDKSETPFNDLAMYIQEKGHGLRRQAMPPAGLSVQPIECEKRLLAMFNADGELAALCSADCATY